jgi:hypothetical protein
MAHVLTELRVVPKVQAEDAAAIARELGLELQARRYEKPLAENAFTALTDDEVTLWAHHCPTRYFQPPVASGNRSLEQYAFDSVPIEVMRHWKTIKDNYSFDRYEVWTTERTRALNDPLLIGVIGQKLYLLARWGMESPDHLPLKQIAQQLYAEGIESAANHFVDFPFQSRASRIASNKRWLRRMSSTFAAAERYLGLE